ncbi:hypothetical protein FACS1894169_03920 [Bacteroidia bacterium]|nr:hypothetical protein FACS1894169_03920 [Bacteroidia bacterium]
MKFKAIIYILLLFVSVGCIEEYHAKGVEELSNLLVVEGTITEGTTTIKLSRSVGLYDNASASERVSNAIVSVESDAGKEYSAISGTGGIYTIYIEKLDPETKYRLKIQVDGEEYESTYSKPILTPDIDKIFWTKDSNKGVANICVTTHGANDQPRYYSWSYNEIWEIRAKLYSNFMYGADNIIIPYNEITGSYNLKYYCWKSDKSNKFILASSDKLSENVITEKKLVETTPSHERFSELYYIKVYQNMLSKEAYDYFTNLQKNIESTGSIFSPVPSEIRGNIFCTTNPDIPVIGYVDVSVVKTKEVYIYPDEGLYEPKLDYLCFSVTKNDERYDESGMLLYYYEEMDPANSLYSYPECFDCTKRGTKNKPNFWPNDHK